MYATFILDQSLMNLHNTKKNIRADLSPSCHSLLHSYYTVWEKDRNYKYREENKTNETPLK